MAQKLAFKKTLTPGSTMPAQVASLYTDIKTYITNTGFSVLSFSDSGIGGVYIDFMRAGASAADTSDDCPHWAIILASDTITMQCVHGSAYDDPAAAKTYEVPVINAASYTTGMPDHLVRFYCDAAVGIFWLYITNTSTSAHTSATVATTLRRYPADTTQGLMCRYGLFKANPDGTFTTPYATDIYGEKLDACEFDLWSPLLGGNGSSPIRHPSSPLPAMHAPLFAKYYMSEISACMPGELEHVQLLTTSVAGDYTLEQVLTPGIMALPDTAANRWHLALPYTAFTVL